MSRLARSMALVRWALVLGSGAVAAYSIATYGFSEDHASSEAPRYSCPMHPEIRTHDPGTCPICHMDLVPIPETHRHGSARPRDAPEGLGEVSLALERRQRFGIESVAVVRRALATTSRWPATVEAPESAVADVRVRVPAFVERLAVDRVGVVIRRGQTLASLFSPEVARLGDELAVAHELGEGTANLVDGARVGLVRAGVNPDSVATAPIDRRGRFVVTSPRAGVVTRVSTSVGAYATPEVALFEVTDLARLRVVANVPDTERTRITADTRVRFERTDGTTFELAFDVVEPTVDVATRTVRVRFAAAQGSGALSPGDVGTLLAAGDEADALVVPRDALLDTGTVRYVFVDHGEGVFEPRIVVTGSSDGSAVAVVSGLAENERVVARGGFLLDSESRLGSSTNAPTRDAGSGRSP